MFVFLCRRASVLLPPLQPGLRRPLQPAGSPADPRRGEEVPVQRLLAHLQPHVAAAETQLLGVLLHLSMRWRVWGAEPRGARSSGELPALDERRGPHVHKDHDLEGMDVTSRASSLLKLLTLFFFKKFSRPDHLN